jgi:hypothetical protein
MISGNGKWNCMKEHTSRYKRETRGSGHNDCINFHFVFNNNN